MDIGKFVDMKDLVSNAANLTGLVILLLLTAFSKKVKAWMEKKTNDKFERSINKSSIIRDNLAGLRAILGAERVMLFQLHNGQYYFSGEGADKLSLTHFVVSTGVAVPDRAGTRLQNIPITYWPEAFKIMSEKGYFLATTDSFDDPFVAQMFSMDGVAAAICGPVKDRRNFWRGVLVVSYMSGSGESEAVPRVTECGELLGDLLST